MRFPPRQTAVGAARVRRATLEPLETRNLLSTFAGLLKDINPAGNSSPANFTEVGGLTLFSANDGTSGNELWRANGLPGGTVLVKDISPGESSSYVSGARAVMGGVLYFAANDGTSGAELWRSDGTEAGTWRVTDINPTGSSTPVSLTTVGNLVFFTANDGTNGPELWKSDGTEGGTTLVQDLRPGPIGSAPGSLLDVSGTLFFTANDGTTGVEIWKSDGTPGGITLVKDIRPGTSPSSQVAWLTNVDGTLFFAANQSGSVELWKSDGSPEGTIPVQEVVDGGPASPASLVNFDGSLFFVASGPGTGNELWKSDGSPEGTMLVKDILPGDGSSNPVGLTVAGERLFFFANDGASGNELWKSNGTPAGTTLVRDINPGPASSVLFFMPGIPTPLVGVRNLLFFPASDGVNGTELWRSDGTSAGTDLYWNVAPGAASSNPSRLVASNDRLYFQADNGTHGVEPWVIPLTDYSSTVGRRIFYNQSKFDGNNAAINAADDNAIAIDKVALQFTGSTTSPLSAFTSYSRGINGIMVDLGDAAGVTVDDFTFKVGTNSTVSSWANAPAPSGFSIRHGAGVGGSDRVVITWPNNAIQNTWLQVIVEGNDPLGGHNKNTGLSSSDVFFFGNKIGDTFISSPPTIVSTSAADALAARANPGFLQPITNPYDFDRNQAVGAGDELTARTNAGFLTRNLTWTPPASPLAAALASEDDGLAESFDDLAAAVASALAMGRLERVLPDTNTRLPRMADERGRPIETSKLRCDTPQVESRIVSDRTPRGGASPASDHGASLLKRFFERSLLD